MADLVAYCFRFGLKMMGLWGKADSASFKNYMICLPT